MEQLLEGKRVFKQDNEQDRYLVFVSSEIKKYIDLTGTIAVKKGDLLSPLKWEVRDEKLNDRNIIPADSLDTSDYDYIFYPNLISAKSINKHFSTLLPKEHKGTFKDLLSLPELPAILPKGEEGLKRLLDEENCLNDFRPIEAFSYVNGGEVKFFILVSEFSSDDITDEYTEDFKKQHIISHYERLTDNGVEHLYKTVPDDRKDSSFHHSHSVRWYRYYQGDKNQQFFALKELHDIDDVIPFTAFQLSNI